ncbi:MAG: bifunctional N-acetylglucosamine-1-phosphate uridyltransferase/glucosamine-1-phosphate acetyltransferase [Desulfurivibrionaceae bacterium]
MIGNSVSRPANDMDHSAVSALILAAGKGTRMKSELAKVLHPVCFKPMIHHVLDCVLNLDLDNIVLVTGHQAEAVENSCSFYPLHFVRQNEQLGTGHAVLTAESHIKDAGGVVMILCGDTPLLSPQNLQGLLDSHLAGDHLLTVASTVLDDPSGYGRLIVDGKDQVTAIVEEKDATAEEKKINLINTGIYCVDCGFLFDSLKKVGSDNEQGEVYLTDIVSLASRQGYSVNYFRYPDPVDVLGVNSRVELAQAHGFLQKRYLNRLMSEGVSVLLPETVTVDPASLIGEDTVIKPNVYISGRTRIGRNCRIDSFTCIHDSIIGDNVTIGAGAYLESTTVDTDKFLEPGVQIR